MSGGKVVDKIIGFAIHNDVRNTTFTESSLLNEIRSTLQDFPWLIFRSFNLGQNGNLILWGHGDYQKFYHYNTVNHQFSFLCNSDDADYFDKNRNVFTITPVGIFNFVFIKDQQVEIYNDWTGASKIYYQSRPDMIIIATLEPVVVKYSKVGTDDFNPVSLYSLMSLGSFTDNNTLYKNIFVQHPDTYTTYKYGDVKIKRLKTIQPSEQRWTRGWDELTDEWYDVMFSSFKEVFGKHKKMTLMLSGGIDSRMVAIVGKELGIDFDCVSYGNKTWQDGIIAKKVAEALGYNMQYQLINKSYLKDYTEPWLRWFGASMCVHGMYQLPALHRLKLKGMNQTIVTGFTGDPLEGAQTEKMMFVDKNGKNSLLDRFYRKNKLLSDEQISTLLPDLKIKNIQNEIENNLREQYDSYDGADFQKIWLLFQWNKVFQFSSYQPIMYEYFNGVVTPFVHKDFANFTLSLPRLALERRWAFYEMIKKKLKKFARIPGTYDHATQQFDFLPKNYGIPFLLTKEYLLKASIGYFLPEKLRRGPFREFMPSTNTFAFDSIRSDGIDSLYPLNIINPDKQTFFESVALNKLVQSVLQEKNNLFLSQELWPVQTILYRVMNNG